MQVNNRDLLFEKECIHLHVTKMQNLIRVHSDLIFKNKKGKKFKDDLLFSLMEIENMLGKRPDNFYKVDGTFKAVSNLVNNAIEKLGENDLIGYYKIPLNDEGNVSDYYKNIAEKQEGVLNDI